MNKTSGQMGHLQYNNVKTFIPKSGNTLNESEMIEGQVIYKQVRSDRQPHNKMLVLSVAVIHCYST